MRLRVRGAWLGLALGLWLGLAAVADDYTPPLSITKIELPDGLNLWADNHQGVELTITLEPTELENVVCDPPWPLTVTIPGGQRTLLGRIRRAERDRSWRCNYRWFWTWGPLQAEHDETCVYRLPYTGRYKVSQGYNGVFSHSGDSRYALDFDLPLGTPVLACREGSVIAIEERYDEGGAREYYRNRVNKVVVKHTDGTLGEYDHFRSQGVEVKVGDSLEPGSLVGYSGATGYVSGPHLHFMVYKALDGRQRQSFPTRFRVKGAAEPMLLEQGQYYASP